MRLSPSSVANGISLHLFYTLLHVGAARHHKATVNKVSWPLLFDVTTDHISEFKLGLVYAFETLLYIAFLNLYIFLILANTFEIVSNLYNLA